MKINLNEIDSKQFYCDIKIHPDIGEVILIIPKKIKHSWEESELHLRSLLCLPDGMVISSGFKKFFNFGEKPEHDLITDESFRLGKVIIPLKMDGSLIIRFVYDGKVYFRTRGSIQLGDFKEPIMSLVKAEYSKLLDPNYISNKGMCFEFTSPDNRVIEAYKEKKLTFLGLSDYSGETLEFDYSEELGKSILLDSGVEFPESFSGWNSFSELFSSIRSMDETEGVVVWCKTTKGTHMAKVKTKQYLLRHSLKFHLGYNKLKMFCFSNNITTKDHFIKELFKLKIDWEGFSVLEASFDTYIERYTKISNEFLELNKKIIDLDIPKIIKSSSKDDIKKSAIIVNYSFSKKEKHYVFLYIREDYKGCEQIIWSDILEITRTGFKHYSETAKSFTDNFKGVRFGAKDKEH